VGRAQHVGHHDLVLGEPDLQLLVPSPVSGVTARCISQPPCRGNMSKKRGHSQLYCRQVLLEVLRTAVEDPEQGLLVEATNFRLDRLDVCHVVAIGQLVLGDGWSWRNVVEKRIDLGRERPGNRSVNLV
jgi:hypothetical protein